VGDHVEVDGIVGDIIDIQILRTTVRECRGWLSSDDHTGRVVFIPNNFIFKHHLFNYSYVHPNVWQQMEVTVTFETPVEETRELLLKILREETRDDLQEFNEGETRFGHRYNLETAPKEPKMHVIIADSGVLFRMFFPAHYGQVSGTRSRISQRILAEFAQRPRIQFAYPTQRHIPTAEADGFKVQVLNPAR
jgi:small-conductance mechanosensitive channel